MKIKPISTKGRVLASLKPNQDLPSQSQTTPPQRPLFLQIKNILVPIDFSECSKKALQYAIPFAKQFNATLTLLSVAEFNGRSCRAGNGASEDNILQNCEVRLLNLVKEQIGDDLACETLVWKGKTVSDIIGAAKSRHIDLIIISTRGDGSMNPWLKGSTTERVIRQAPCPVLVVREREHDFV